MSKKLLYRIDLTKIEGEGDFPCPSCGSIISPDDESGLVYEIIDVRTDEEGRLKDLLIVCKQCGSEICLEGFEMLKDLGDLEGADEIEDL